MCRFDGWPSPRLDVGSNLSRNNTGSSNAGEDGRGHKENAGITIETDEVTMIRRRMPAATWCRECACEVEVVGMEEAGVLAGMTERALQNCAQSQGWHLSDAGDGTLLVCLKSLLKTM